MKKLFGYIIVKEKEFPALQKAHRLARTLTDVAIDDILMNRVHLHHNPRKKTRVFGCNPEPHNATMMEV